MSFIRKIIDHKALLKSTFFVFALNGVKRLSGLITIYVLVRALSQTQFGEYQFILSLVGILTIFSMPGLNNAVMQSIARGHKGTFRASLKPSFLSSLIGALILCGIGGWYFFTKESGNLHITFFVVAAFFPSTHGLRRWRAVKTGTESFSFLFLADGLIALLTAILAISVALLVPDPILWLLIVVMLVPSIQNLLLTYLTLKKIDHNAPVEDGSIAYGIKITAYSSINIVANHLDKLLIYGFFSPASLAIYFAADRMAELTNNPLSPPPLRFKGAFKALPPKANS